MTSYIRQMLGLYPGGCKEMARDNAYVDATKTPPMEEWQTNPDDVEKWEDQPAESLVCKTDNLKYIERLLILGTGQQNKYKSGVSKISLEDLALVQREIDSPNCYKLLDMVADIYLKGRAPKQDMTMQVLALICRCETNVTLRRRGYEVVGQLRTLSQLYLFLSFYTGTATQAVSPRTVTKKGSTKVSNETSNTMDVSDGANSTVMGGLAPHSKGFGRAFKTALNRSFLKKTPQALAYQVTKYQSRGDWGFNDIIKCTHLRTGTGENRKRNTKYLKPDFEPKPIKPATPMDLVLRYSMYGMVEMTKLALAFNLLKDPLYQYLWAVDSAKNMQENETEDLIHLILKYRLVREHLPTWSLKNCAVQKALLLGDTTLFHDGSLFLGDPSHRVFRVVMPMTALLRNLASLTSIGLFEDKELLSLVVKHLTDKDAVQKSRIHPVNVIIAWFVYRKGKGFKGKLTWTPQKKIVDALEQMAFLAFANAPPTTKRYGVFIDGSGSMTTETTFQGLSNADIAALLSLVIARSGQGALPPSPMRPQAQLQGHLFYVFSAKSNRYFKAKDESGLYDVGHQIHVNSTFQEVLDAVQISNWGATDISNGIRYLEHSNKHVDAIIVITDNDINTGEKPLVALNSYRAKIGNPNVKLITLAVELNDLTIADPSDKGMLDMCGFDTNSYQVMHAFTHDTPFGGGGDEAEAE